MFINGDGNWVYIKNDAVITYNINIHSTINMRPVDASNNPDKVRYITEPASQIRSTSTKIEPKFKVGDYVRNAAIYVLPFLKITLLIGINNYLKLMKF